MTSDFARPLDHVLLNLTRRCNQRCVFCFEGDRSGWGEPSLDDVKRLLDASAERYRHGVLMGAEALLRRDIVAIVEHATSVGMGLTAFTNGVALAKDGLLEALLDVGLRSYAVSCHFPDAETYARAARAPARQFGTWKKGLANLARVDQAREGGVDIHTETLLSVFNFGRLAEIMSVLEEILGPSFREHSLKTLKPLCDEGDGGGLLEPMAARRDELAALMATWPDARQMRFVGLPLCLVPGREHFSRDVRYAARQSTISSNFLDKAEIQLETRQETDLAANPYRWVCAECNLLALCPTARTRWHSASYLPDRDQRPLPVRDTTVADVLARLADPSPDALRDIDRVREGLRAVPMPEAQLVARLRRLGGAIVTQDVWAPPRPGIAAALAVGGEPVVAEVVFPAAGEPAGYLFGFLGAVLRPADDAAPLAPAVRDATLARLAFLGQPPLADLDTWAAETETWRWFDGAVARSTAALSAIFGPALWPGTAAFAGWRVADVTWAEGGGLVLTLSRPEGLRAEVFLYAGPLVTRRPPAPGASVVWRTPVAAAFLLLTDDPADDALGRHRALEALAEALTDALRRAAAGPAPAGADDEDTTPRRDDALHMVFRDRTGRSDYAFVIGRAREGEPAFRRIGPIGITHAPCRTGNVFQAFATLVEQVARVRREPPTAATAGEWLQTFRMLLARTPLARRYACSATWVPPAETP